MCALRPWANCCHVGRWRDGDCVWRVWVWWECAENGEEGGGMRRHGSGLLGDVRRCARARASGLPAFIHPRGVQALCCVLWSSAGPTRRAGSHRKGVSVPLARAACRDGGFRRGQAGAPAGAGSWAPLCPVASCDPAGAWVPGRPPCLTPCPCPPPPSCPLPPHRVQHPVPDCDSTVVVHVRGLPLDASPSDVVLFFSGLPVDESRVVMAPISSGACACACA